MFQTALIESNHAIRSNSRWPALASIALQAACAAALLAIPMVRPEVLTPRSITLPLAPPPIQHVPQPPPQHVRLLNANTSLPTVAVATERPPIFSTHIPSLNNLTDGPPVSGPIRMTNGSGDPGNGIPGLDTPPAAASVSVAAPAGAHAGPANVSRGVAQGLLLTQIRPDYPRIAVMTHTSGTVTVLAIISRSGAIESAHAISGPDLLRAAAVDAVRQARYRPYLLNGQPTEVEATYTINFNLSSN
jgi:protein TonB